MVSPSTWGRQTKNERGRQTKNERNHFPIPAVPRAWEKKWKKHETKACHYRFVQCAYFSIGCEQELIHAGVGKHIGDSMQGHLT